MKFLDKWQAVWMAVAFAEANEPETATEIYDETRQRVAERKRQTPRQRTYRT
jgi:hypothetical protein